MAAPASPPVLLAAESLGTGGLEEQVAFLAEGLPAAGVVCASGGAVARRLRDAGVTVVDGGADRGVVRAALWRLRPSVVSSHLAPAAVLEEAAALGIPVVETVHNTYVWFDDTAWEAERRKGRHLTGAVAVSERVRGYYAARCGDGVALTVIPNAPAPARLLAPPRDVARARLGAAPPDVVLLVLGRMVPEKNPLGVVGAFGAMARRHPSLRLVLAGRRPPEHAAYHAALREAIARSPAAARITVLDEQGDPARLLVAADVLVVDSFFEGWSLAATEALCLGTPIVHSRCGSAEELCAGGRRGLVVPNPGGDREVDLPTVARLSHVEAQENTAELVAALTRIVEDRPAWAARRGELAAESRRAFAPEAALERYREVFAAAARP